MHDECACKYACCSLTEAKLHHTLTVWAPIPFIFLPRTATFVTLSGFKHATITITIIIIIIITTIIIISLKK